MSRTDRDNEGRKGGGHAGAVRAAGGRRFSRRGLSVAISLIVFAAAVFACVVWPARQPSAVVAGLRSMVYRCMRLLRIEKPRASRVVCGTNVAGLCKSLEVYASEAGGMLPTADKWCDVLLERDYTTAKQFVCKESDAIEGESSYAININVAGRKLSELAGDVVLLFETDFGKVKKGRQGFLKERAWYQALYGPTPNARGQTKVYRDRWNQAGGLEIASTKHHDGQCNVAFADGRVRMLKATELAQLIWDDPGIHKATIEGDIEKLRSILTAGPKLIGLRDRSGKRPLHLAAERGRKDVVEFLLDKGADVNARDKLGRTALGAASERGYDEAAELLRRHGGIE